MPSNTIACAENGYKSRITLMTSVETQWIEALQISELDLSKPFLTKDAYTAIKQVPTKGGKVRKIMPEGNCGLVYVMKKSGLFIRQNKKPARWTLVQEDYR